MERAKQLSMFEQYNPAIDAPDPDDEKQTKSPHVPSIKPSSGTICWWGVNQMGKNLTFNNKK